MNLFGWLKPGGNRSTATQASDHKKHRQALDRPNKPIREPWIGSDFRSNRNGLFIVGESHYWDQDDRDDPQMTLKTMNSVFNGRRYRFFTLAEAAIRGVEPADVQPNDFWTTHAFANFCQGAFPAAGVNPPQMRAEMFRRGVETFPAVLRYVNPKRMLVFSTQVWNQFEKFETIRWRSEAPIKHEGNEIDNGYLTDVDGQFHVYCTWLPHPGARRWNPPIRWTPLINEFLSRDLQKPPTS